MTKIYKRDSINWIVTIISIITIFNLIGLLIMLLYETEITINRIVLHTAIGLVFIIIAYLRNVDKIEFKDDKITISKSYRRFSDLESNFKAIEKNKITRTLHRYKQLRIKNIKSNMLFRIDSDEWKDYVQIKQILLEKNIMEYDNE